jgi:hypothetical protein
LIAAMFFSLVFAGVATAANVHLFKEALGGGTPPTFTKSLGVAVDQSNGDVLVLDGGTNEVQSLKVAATAGQFKLTFGGQTTGWTGQATLSPSSTSVTGFITSTGNISKGEEITGTGIKPNTKVSACAPTNCIGVTAITLSQATEASAGGNQNLSAEIPFNISAANLREALERLPSIGVNSPSKLVVANGPGNVGGTVPYAITFQNGLGGRDVEQITAANGATPLSGGSPSSEAVVSPTTTGVLSGIRRFKPDGTPDNFSALGSNVIDGQRGPGGRPKAECESAPEPASCDETPLNGIGIPVGSTSAFNVQIAVDNSGGIADGNIYLSQRETKSIYIFSSVGKYLGALTAAGATPFAGEPSGVAVAPNGHFYIAQSGSAANKVVFEFVPSSSTPTNSDFVKSLTLANVAIPSQAAAGAGAGATSTLGSVFVAKNTVNPVVKLSSSLAESYSLGSGQLVAVNPSTGTVLVSGASAATEYDASSEASAVPLSTLTAGSTIQGLSVRGATGNIYVSRSGSTTIDVFGPAVSTPTTVSFEATGLTPTAVILNGAVSTEANPVEECVFEYGKTTTYGQNAPCSGSIVVDNKLHPVSSSIGGLEPETTYHFRVKAKNAAGTAESADKTFVTSSRAITDEATGVADGPATTDGSAILNGRVNPIGSPLTACKFEFLTEAAYLANGQSYSGPKVPQTKSCSPTAASIAPDFQYHAVSGTLAGLAENTTYHFRLSETSASGTFTGDDLSFTTRGPPLVTEELPLWVDKTTATLRAKVNPSGQPTNYRFEWGPTGSYGNQTPADFEPALGADTSAVPVIANLSGLEIGTSYHFRVVATSASGVTDGLDQEFQTLDSCGLIDGRCFELVSPAEKGPVGEAGQSVALAQNLIFQTSPDGERIAYQMAYGLPDSTTGGEVIYQANRGIGGWLSEQTSPGQVGQSVQAGRVNVGSLERWRSRSLGCGFLVSTLPLTSDPSALPAFEAGGANLYRRSSDGSYTLVSNLTPTNPSIAPTLPDAGNPEPLELFSVVGAGENCQRIVFRSPYQYPEIAYSGVGTALPGLYEWDNGQLLNAGVIPTPAGPQAALPAKTSVTPTLPQHWNEVSEDGSRVIFMAISKQGPDQSQEAVFLREEGATGIDISQSQTAVPNTATSTFQMASIDGSSIFLTAKAGIAANSSPTATGRSLYRYESETGVLQDVSSDHNPADVGGASVKQVFDASADGSAVYFAAQGQLILGEGNTYAQNQVGAGAVNVYRAHVVAGTVSLSFVASISEVDAGSAPKTAEATPDGKHFLFQAAANVTGYDSGGTVEAYLYSAETGTTVCISCRRDGQPSIGTPIANVGPLGGGPANPVAAMHPATQVSDDGTRVFFGMRDALAPGAQSGEINLYEWEKGQIALLTSGIGGVEAFYDAALLGASENGDSVFLRTKRALVPQDTDERQDVYVARVGGGFAPSPSPPAPCQALVESSCSGASSVSGGSLLSPASSTFKGPGNEKSSKKHKPKKHKPKKHKPKKHKRNANTTGRAAK